MIFFLPGLLIFSSLPETYNFWALCWTLLLVETLLFLQAEGTRELVEEEGVGGGGGVSNLVSVSGNRVIVNSNSGGSSEEDDANRLASKYNPRITFLQLAACVAF